jgi:hypothetical protein
LAMPVLLEGQGLASHRLCLTFYAFVAKG